MGVLNRVEQYNREHNDEWKYGDDAANAFMRWKTIAYVARFAWDENAKPIYNTTIHFECTIDGRKCDKWSNCNKCIFAAKHIGLGIECVPSILEE